MMETMTRALCGEHGAALSVIPGRVQLGCWYGCVLWSADLQVDPGLALDVVEDGADFAVYVVEVGAGLI